MRRRTTAPLLLTVAAFLLALSAAGQTGDALLDRLARQRQDRAVHDFAGVLATGERDRLESLLRDLHRQAGVAVVVVAVRSMEGGQIDDFATRLYERWGIGRKGQDEGVLLLAAIEDRKVRIEPGYGMEGLFPDAKCGRILDEYVLPFFRDDQYGPGLVSGGAAIAGLIARERGVRLSAPTGHGRATREGRGSPWLTLLLFVIMVPIVIRHPWLLFFILSSGRGGGGGGFGGGLGGFGGGLSGGGGASRGW